jgi:hypothetical protein
MNDRDLRRSDRATRVLKMVSWMLSIPTQQTSIMLPASYGYRVGKAAETQRHQRLTILKNPI